jgi:small subunit ribosomal protein S17e
MGKIKTKLIKRTANELMKSKDIEFSEDFEKNKKLLGKEMPSKKIKNQVAGYIARVKKREKQEKEKIEESIKASKK